VHFSQVAALPGSDAPIIAIAGFVLSLPIGLILDEEGFPI